VDYDRAGMIVDDVCVMLVARSLLMK
jgi:hypothetical protein